MTRRATRLRMPGAAACLLLAGMIVLGGSTGGVGFQHAIAASQGCDLVNGLEPFEATELTLPSTSWDAGEVVTFTAVPLHGNPTTIEILAGGVVVSSGLVPGPISYTIPFTGEIAALRFRTNLDSGSSMFTLTCAIPPTPTPTRTPTNTPTKTPTSSPTSSPTVTNTPSATAPTTPTATKTPTKTPTSAPGPIPIVGIDPVRGTVNTSVSFAVSGFPPNTPLSITWQRLSGSIISIPSPFVLGGTGARTGKFKVPATTGGPGQQITFTAGSVSRTVLYEVAPRIKVLENPVARGQVVNVSLRGYAKNETVRIRWKHGDRWVQVATVVTSNTGSANVSVTVPTFAVDGFNSVRGDGTVFRQQTNAVNVSGADLTTTTTSATFGGGTAGSHPAAWLTLAAPLASAFLLSGQPARYNPTDQRRHPRIARGKSPLVMSHGHSRLWEASLVVPASKYSLCTIATTPNNLVNLLVESTKVVRNGLNTQIFRELRYCLSGKPPLELERLCIASAEHPPVPIPPLGMSVEE